MDYEIQKHRILEDMAVSFWLKRAIVEIEQRDPLDAASDAQILAELMVLRETEMLYINLQGRTS